MNDKKSNIIAKFIYLSLLVVMFLSVPYYGKAERGIAVRPVSPSGDLVSGDQWLFVIGIDTYRKWPRLNTAVNDARSVKDVLLSRYYFDKKNLIELYNEQATRKNILKQLVYLAKNVRKDDSLMIFYAGHGHLDPITKEGSWIPVESGIEDVSARISNHDIKKYLSVDAIKASHILLVSDSCFSGDFFRGARGKLPAVTNKVIKLAYKLTSRQAITSGGLEPVSDAGFGNNSVFSHFFVKTLKENQKPFLIPSDLFADIKAGVVENAEQFPRYGTLKDTGGQQGGELIFFLKQDMCLKNLSAEAKTRQQELERLKQMEATDREAKKKEAAEIAKQKKKLTALDAQIEAMRKRLGGSAVSPDDSLDTMLAMVEQKETQAKRLEELRRKKEAEERKRKKEIAQLKRERETKIIAGLKPEIEKYKKIIASKYGQSMKTAAWKSLIAKCPPGWADGVKEGDCDELLFRTKSGGKEDEQSKLTAAQRSPDHFGLALLMACGMSAEDARKKIEAYTIGDLRIKHLVGVVVPIPKQGAKTPSGTDQQLETLTNSIAMRFVLIPNGTFMMGSQSSEPGRCSNEKQHRVTINRSFYLQATEVTQGQWKKIMRNNPSCFKGDNRPVEQVSGDDAKEFIRRLNKKEGTNKYRLPTEAEWEYACRAGSNTRFCFGNSDNGLGEYAWYSDNSSSETHPVAQKKPNVWGLYDMHGNVWEWCQDQYCWDYPSGHVTDPEGPSSGSNRVYRGGSCFNSVRFCRAAYRNYYSPGNRNDYLGFRLACRAGGRD